jgi:hypothetical protein
MVDEYIIHHDASLTSREKAIPDALKWLIPGAFRFTGDLHAGGNAYRWRILQFAGEFFLPLAYLVCAPGITCYP